MSKRGTVPPSQKQTAEFHSTVIIALPELTPEQMQTWIGKKKVLQKKFRELFIGATEDSDIAWSDEWTRFYQEVFGLKVNLADVVLPPETEGFGWTLAIAKELGDNPINTAMAACRKLFGNKVWQYADDMDKSVPTNDRDPRRDGSYAIRVRDRVEADEENKNLSANTVKSRNMVTVTLLERIVLELFHFWKTGKHLDIQNITLCSGSRDSDGDVPRCCWRFDEFGVCWGSLGYCRDNLRSRSAVI